MTSFAIPPDLAQFAAKILYRCLTAFPSSYQTLSASLNFIVIMHPGRVLLPGSVVVLSRVSKVLERNNPRVPPLLQVNSDDAQLNAGHIFVSVQIYSDPLRKLVMLACVGERAFPGEILT